MSVEQCKFFPPICIYRPRWGCCPWNFVTPFEFKNRIMALPDSVNSFMIGIYNNYDIHNATWSDRRTEGRREIIYYMSIYHAWVYIYMLTRYKYEIVYACEWLTALFYRWTKHPPNTMSRTL